MSSVKEAIANTRKNRNAGGPGPNTAFVSGDTTQGTVKKPAPQVAPVPKEEEEVDQ
jgi:hypothetical protein